MWVLLALSRASANIDHAVVAAVVPVTVTPSSTGLGNRVGRANLASKMTVTVIVVVPGPTVVVVSRVAIYEVVVGIARVNGASSFINYYRLSIGNDDGYRGLLRAGIAVVATVGFAVLTFVGTSVMMARVIVQITLITRDTAGMVVPIGGTSYHKVSLTLLGNDVTLDRGRGTRLVPISIAVSVSVRHDSSEDI